MADMSQVPHVLFILFRAWLWSILTINLLFMLISPRAWSRLPWWLTVPDWSDVPGTASVNRPNIRERLTSGWGAAFTRLVAAAVIVWIVHAFTKGPSN
jgi:hypothetical protein